MMLTIVIVHLMGGEPAADSLDVATEASVARIIGWGIRFKLQMLCSQEDE